MLYAQDRWAVLLIFQAMDAAGKDGAIKHVMSGVNPQGCQVFSFKAPVAPRSSTTTSCGARTRCLPERGRIGIFNRSYYEEVLVVRVHPEILAQQKLPAAARDQATSGRSASRTSAASSATSTRNGIVVRKFFLHVSKEEQKRALPRAARRAREELEVLAGRRRASASTGTTTCAPTRT